MSHASRPHDLAWFHSAPKMQLQFEAPSAKEATPPGALAPLASPVHVKHLGGGDVAATLTAVDQENTGSN